MSLCFCICLLFADPGLLSTPRRTLPARRHSSVLSASKREEIATLYNGAEKAPTAQSGARRKKRELRIDRGPIPCENRTEFDKARQVGKFGAYMARGLSQSVCGDEFAELERRANVGNFFDQPLIMRSKHKGFICGAERFEEIDDERLRLRVETG